MVRIPLKRNEEKRTEASAIKGEGGVDRPVRLDVGARVLVYFFE